MNNEPFQQSYMVDVDGLSTSPFLNLRSSLLANGWGGVQPPRPARFAFNRRDDMILQRVEEHKMQILGRIALVTATILLIIVLILIVIWPYLQGIFLPSRLACGSDVVNCFDRIQIVPGETFSKTLYFNNQCSYPRDYRVTFVPQGPLWSCDGSGKSLYYETGWSQGADLHLEPGETESVTIDVIFPQPASNECQGKTGHLVVRHYFLDLDQEEGTCECQLSPMSSLLRTAFLGSSDLISCPCAEVEWSQFDFNHP